MRGRTMRWAALPLAVAALAGGGAAVAATGGARTAHATVQAHHTTRFGTVLFAANGRVLYRFMHDSKGHDRCAASAACLKAWPPLTVPGGTSPTAGPGVNAALLGTVAFAGGRRQVTYGGYPLYLFAADKDGGDAYGQGLEHAWFVVGTKGAPVRKAAAPAATTTPAPTTTAPAGGGNGYGGSYG